jgi:acylphosphatase
VAAEIIVEGLVQGVGYRDYAQRRAALLGLTGYVMNLRDGRVKVHVEGTREAVGTLTKDLQKGPPLARVANCSVTWLPVTGKYRAFSIRLSEFG